MEFIQEQLEKVQQIVVEKYNLRQGRVWYQGLSIKAILYSYEYKQIYKHWSCEESLIVTITYLAVVESMQAKIEQHLAAQKSGAKA